MYAPQEPASSAKGLLISIVIPVFNEELNVLPAYEAVVRVFDELGNSYRLELIFSDNHSTDGTFSRLKALAAKDSRVRVLRLNRNYGFQRSLLTAYRHASGDAAIQIDCDLQDSPEHFKEFIAHWEKGHDVVVGLRRLRKENRALAWGRRVFYTLLDNLSEDRITRNAGDFRLIDRRILDQLRQINDQSPYVRGLISSLAVNEASFPYDRKARQYEQSKFPLRKLFGFALNGIYSHSVIPLRLATYIGITISILTCLLSAFYIISAGIFGETWPRGFATTTVLILFGIGLNGIFMGIMGEYIARIYYQVRQRPLTVIEQSINFPGVDK